MHKFVYAASLIFTLLGTGCTAANNGSLPATGQLPTSDPAHHTLTVFAAASLTGAFQEIGKQFESANPGVQVNFNFAGSQILQTQLEQGAPADVFASADHKTMDLVAAENLVLVDQVHDFATNSLIVILPAKNPGNINSLADLALPGTKIILADASVPAGNYARQVLTKINQDGVFGPGYSENVLKNVVSNETDVKQVVTKVELGEADAGIVYVSDAVAAPGLISLAIPGKFNVTARYPIAVLIHAPEAQLADAFVEFVTSTEGRAILEKWGFNHANP